MFWCSEFREPPDVIVLAYAASHHNVSRAGRPDPDELTVEETQWIMDASRQLPIDILWITSETLPDMSKGEDSFGIPIPG